MISLGHDKWVWADRDEDDPDLVFWPSYEQGLLCPHGEQGDLLWVRETSRKWLIQC